MKAAPHDDEVTVCIRSDRWLALVWIIRVAADLDRRPVGRAVGSEVLSLDYGIFRIVFSRAAPHDDEVAVCARRDGRLLLIIIRVAADLELRPVGRTVGRETSALDLWIHTQLW